VWFQDGFYEWHTESRSVLLVKSRREFLSTINIVWKVFLMEKVEEAKIFALKELGYEPNCLAIESLHKKEMAARAKELSKVDKAMAQQVADQVGGKVVDLAIEDVPGLGD
jgi:hypothetical protein